MLTNTFIHIQGIGAKTEQRLWDSGFRDWNSFSRLIPSNQGWRMFPEFRNSTVYLDTETTGLDRYSNLENLMVTAYNMKLRETPFYKSHYIQESTSPSNPFRVDLATVDRIKISAQYWSSQQWY